MESFHAHFGREAVDSNCSRLSVWTRAVPTSVSSLLFIKRSFYGATENARPDIARPSKLWKLTSRDLTTRHHVPFADFAFLVCYALMSRKTTELYVKVLQRVQQLVPQFAPTWSMVDFEEASVAEFFLDCVKLLCRPSALLLLHFHQLTHTCAVDGVC